MNTGLSLLVAQVDQAEGGTAPLLFGIIWLAIVVIIIVGIWKMYSKAGQPGWGCLIPFLQQYLLVKIAGRPGWWFLLLCFVPVVNIVIWVIVSIDIAKNFGRGMGVALGIIFLWPIFLPILGFGSARYEPVPH